MGGTSWLGRQVGATAGGGRGREREEVGAEGRGEDTGACQSRSCREKGQEEAGECPESEERGLRAVGQLRGRCWGRRVGSTEGMWKAVVFCF